MNLSVQLVICIKRERLNLYEDIIKDAQMIGITAGASTPQIIIDKVIEKIKKGN